MTRKFWMASALALALVGGVYAADAPADTKDQQTTKKKKKRAPKKSDKKGEEAPPTAQAK
jgi:hypothetical protein